MNQPPRPRDPVSGLPLADLTRPLTGGSAEAWSVHLEALARVRRGEKVIVLTVGDPDLDTPPAIVETAIDSLRRGRTHYSPVIGEPDFRAAIAAAETRRIDRHIDAAEVAVTHGAQGGLFAALRCLVQSGDEVVVFDPAYVTFEGAILACDARMVRAPLAQSTAGFAFDLAALKAAITPATRVIFANFPHNPTGTLWSETDLAAIAELCHAHDLWLLSDEVYCDLVYDKPSITPRSMPELAERTIVVRSLSKSHAMTGWRIGWVLAPRAVIAAMEGLANSTLYGVAPYAQDASVVALTTAMPAVDEIKAIFKRRRDLLISCFAGENRLHLVPPDSGIFAVIDIRATGLDDRSFAKRLLDELDVAVLPGGAFGKSLEGYIRLSLCASDADLSEGIARLLRFSAGLSAPA